MVIMGWLLASASTALAEPVAANTGNKGMERGTTTDVAGQGGGATESPHWRAEACGSCHTEPSPKNPATLRDKDVNRLCNQCHSKISTHKLIHASGQKPDAAMRARMPKDMTAALERSGGLTSCIVCHDVPIQCDAKRAAERRLNPFYLRGGPARVRTALCFQCHDRAAYPRMNPHEQFTASGEVNKESCLVCHRTVPERASAEGVRADYNVERDLAKLCDGCHKTEPHPGGFSFKTGAQKPNHLVKPSVRVQKRMANVQELRRVELPLDPTNGQVMCATCHQVHAPGVIASVRGEGGDSKDRVRTSDLCTVCHEL